MNDDSEDLNERFKNVPPVIVGSKLLIRGSSEWEKREWARQIAGCRCLSFGPVPRYNTTVL